MSKVSSFDVPEHTDKTRQWVFKQDWALAPMVCVIPLLGVSFLWNRYTIVADLCAILVCFVLSKWTLNIVMFWRALHQSWMRWAALSCGFLLAGFVAIKLQQYLWQPKIAPHPSWLVPSILAIFILVFVLPGTISAEVNRRTQLAVEQENRKHRLQKQLLEAKLAALQGQIEPHFLYNTLANVRALIRQDAAASETMLTHLIAYLRAAMPDLRSPTTSLGQELERAQAYLQIMQIRLGERLQFSIEAAPDTLNCLIPPLSLMTLVENAIEHAVESQLHGGMINISAYRDEQKLKILVEDNGPGLSSEMGEGVGLLNLQERLQTMYEHGAQLNFDSDMEKGLRVTVLIPLQEKQDVKL